MPVKELMNLAAIMVIGIAATHPMERSPVNVGQRLTNRINYAKAIMGPSG